MCASYIHPAYIRLHTGSSPSRLQIRIYHRFLFIFSFFLRIFFVSFGFVCLGRGLGWLGFFVGFVVFFGRRGINRVSKVQALYIEIEMK